VLHNRASLSYDNSFSRSNRAVSLDGEAYFDVAKDTENTFTVNVDDIDITVYGTTFNVLEDNNSVVVSLVDGSVDVTTKSGMSCALTPGHSAIFEKHTGNLIDRKDDVAFAACWAQDRLTFTQAQLGEVCRYLSKWYGVEIVVDDALKSSCSYTFTIREEPIDQILDIMSRINPMKYIYTNDQRIIISEIL
jgi:ferric-dicitrate binding protein FerR (iron transport regulator)